MIDALVNRVLAPFDYRLQCKSTFKMLERERLALRELLALAGSTSHEPARLEGVVFSKDRPTQLHALLASWFRHATDPVPLHVIYKATTKEQKEVYRDVLDCFDAEWVIPIAQGNFRKDVISLLDVLSCSRILFLVDDIVFIEPFTLGDFLEFEPLKFVPTLRLGRGLTECYTRSKPQNEPPYLEGIVSNPRLLIWRWKQGEHDYGFPLSVDGQIYDRREIAIISKYSEFKAPNTFENALQVFNSIFKERYAVGYTKAPLVNIPLNRVQEEWDSRHGGMHQNDLLKAWRNGLRWDVASLDGYCNRSTHEEIQVKLVPR